MKLKTVAESTRIPMMNGPIQPGAGFGCPPANAGAAIVTTAKTADASTMTDFLIRAHLLIRPTRS